MAQNQAYLFIIFTFVGIIIGMLFDTFRIFRRTFKTNDIITYIEDFLFWTITGFIIVFSMYKFCDGQLRFFMVVGLIIGTLMYLFTISKYVIDVSVHLINIIKRVLTYPKLLLEKIIKKLIFRPFIFICINIRKKFVKKYKKDRGFFVKKEKYNNI